MGSSAGVPDIGIRLTALGVSDVVNAFRQVRQEAKNTKEQGTDLLGGSLQALQSLLPIVTLGMFVDKVFEMGKTALESAEQMGKLSEKTGISAGTLSVLGLAAKETGVDQEALGKGLIKLAKSMQDASDGVAKPKKAFADLGITLNDLKTKDPGQIFAMVAEKLQGIESPALRAQVLISLFGKAGVELLPVMNQVAEQGFGNLEDKAKRLGIYLSGDLVEQMEQAKSTMADLSAAGEGFALEFVTGLMPAVTGVAKAFTDMVGGGDGIQEWGVAVGKQVLLLAADFAYLTKFLQLTRADYMEMQAIANMARDNPYSMFAQGPKHNQIAAQFQADKDELAAAVALHKQAPLDYEATGVELNQAAMGLGAGSHSMAPPRKTGSGGATGNGKIKDDSAKIAAARLAYEKSLADNLLAIHKAANAVEETEDKRRYDAGMMTVDEYYDKVEARIQQNGAQEMADLEAKYAAEAAAHPKDEEARIKQQQEEHKILTQITALEIKQVGDLAKAEADRAAAKIADQQKLLGLEKQLSTASGDRFTAEQDALDKELVDYDALLKKIGDLTDAQRKAKVDAARTAGTAKINFGRDQQAGSDTMAGLNEGIAGIQDQAANGSITNVDAQAKILQLEEARLVTLRAIGDQMAKDAVLSGDPAAIAAAQKYNASLDVMQSKLKNVTSAQTELINQLSGQGYSDLVNFFDAGISGSKSFGAALGDLASNFEGIVSKMISQLLVYYAMMELVGWIAPNSSFLTSLTASGPFGKGYAGGGYTGDMPASKIAGFVHGKEYVFDAQATAAIGTKNLDMIAAGRSMAPVRSISSFTAGIASDYAASIARDNAANPYTAPAPIIQITNTTGQPVSQKQSTGAGGQSITEIIVGTVTADVASGGPIAKRMQTQYGLSRAGAKRG